MVSDEGKVIARWEEEKRKRAMTDKAAVVKMTLEEGENLVARWEENNHEVVVVDVSSDKIYLNNTLDEAVFIHSEGGASHVARHRIRVRRTGPVIEA